MAYTVIIDKAIQKTQTVESVDYAFTKIIDKTVQKTKTVENVDYAVAKVIPITTGIKITEVLPFRIRFTTIGVPPAYAGIPGIGLQIIGISNYIL